MPAELILVVDDEEPNRALLRDILLPLGYRLREACDGEAALAAVAEELPDIILLDVRMPRLDGFGVCRRLKSDPRTRLVPVIILTTLDQLPDKLVAIDAGVDDFLSKPFNVVELTTRVRSLLSLKHFTDELEHVSKVMESIALVIESRDRYTGDHCRRMGQTAMRVGRALGLDAKQLETLRLGGIFHDLGKISISDTVLNKPGPLTPEEFALMRTHPVVGATLCHGMRSMEAVLPLIRHHHEKLDGTGYPDHLAGAQISILTRVISVADVYDVLASKRSYKEAYPHPKCVAILRDEAAKGWWDREVVEALEKTVGPDAISR